MKIAMLINSFYPDTAGGAELFALEISRRLVQRGHKVHVFTSRLTPRHQIREWGYSIGKLERFQVYEGIQIHRVPYIHLSKIGWLSYIFSAIVEFGKNCNFDIVHSHLLISAGLAGTCLKYLHKVPLLITEQGLYHYELKYLASFMRKALLAADQVHVVSEKLREKITALRVPESKITVIPNGVDTGRFTFQSRERSKVREELGLGNEPIVINVSRLVSKNRVNVLLESFKLVLKEIPDAKLIVIGDGPEKRNLQELSRKLGLHDSVHFLSHVPHDFLPSYYGAADVFVRTPMDEGFGIVFIEAMACSLPVIGTNVGGIPDIIKDGENGFLVEKDSSEQIAGRINRLLQDRKLRTKLAYQGRKFVEKKFSWEKITDKIEELYHFMLP